MLRENNPFALYASGASLPELFLALPQAVLCCAQTHAENSGKFDLLHPIKMWLWSRRMRRMNFAAEVSAFIAYRNDGATCFPDEPPDVSESKGRALGQPLLLGMQQFILSLGKNEWSQYGPSAWDYPFGLAQMRYSASAEIEGRLKIKNAVESAEDAAVSEWEKNHPESTLTLIPSNA